jgi:hypothetical protein
MKITLKVLIVFIICILSSCKKDDLENTQDDILTKHMSSTHFDYYYTESDQEAIDTSWQEKYYTWLIDNLNLDSGIKLAYFKYRDREHLKRVTGKETNGFGEVGTNRFHTIWKIDNHESVHIIVTQLIGHPPAIFNEGIAVAHQADYFKYPDFIPGWNGQDFNKLAKNYKQNGEIPSLDKLLGTYSFWDYNSNITYPVSGSFVRYLINHYGLLKMKEFIGKSKFEDSKEKIRNDFMQTYGLSIENVWSEWESFITKL